MEAPLPSNGDMPHPKHGLSFAIRCSRCQASAKKSHGACFLPSTQVPMVAPCLPLHRCPFPFTDAHSHSQVPIPIHRCPFPFTGAHSHSQVPMVAPFLPLPQICSLESLTIQGSWDLPQNTPPVTHSTHAQLLTAHGICMVAASGL